MLLKARSLWFDDLELLEWLDRTARKNRRTPNRQAAWILEQVMLAEQGNERAENEGVEEEEGTLTAAKG